MNNREKFTPLINKKSPSLQFLNADLEKPKKNNSSNQMKLNNQFKFFIPNNLKNKFAATDHGSCIIHAEFSGNILF